MKSRPEFYPGDQVIIEYKKRPPLGHRGETQHIKKYGTIVKPTAQHLAAAKEHSGRDVSTLLIDDYYYMSFSEITYFVDIQDQGVRNVSQGYMRPKLTPEAEAVFGDILKDL